MEGHAEPHDGVAAIRGGVPDALAGGDAAPLGLLRRVLRELQNDARDVFACSGETVERFLRDRQNEARTGFGAPE